MNNLTHGTRKAGVTTGALRVYIANLGAYNEGRLEGSWLSLPATPEEIDMAFKNAGIDGVRYEEHAIHDYENYTGLDLDISEYSSLSHWNELAEQLEGLDDWEKRQITAYCNITGYDALEVIEDSLYENAIYVELDDTLDETTELAYGVVEEIYGGIEHLPENILEFHFDWEHFGRELGWDFDQITEDMDEDTKAELADMTEVEFAEWYVDGLGNLSELGRGTLERYFNYSNYGYDLECQGWRVDRETGLAMAE